MVLNMPAVFTVGLSYIIANLQAQVIAIKT